MTKFTLLFIFTSILGFSQEKVSENEINKLIDNWHLAASSADFTAYFNLMSKDAIFLGTDSKERWSKKEFMDWAKPFFENETAWTLTPVERYIFFSSDSSTAWFDEKLETGMGPARGSGVLLIINNEWKIVHYNLALTIPNEIIPQVRELVEDQLKK